MALFGVICRTGSPRFDQEIQWLFPRGSPQGLTYRWEMKTCSRTMMSVAANARASDLRRRPPQGARRCSSPGESGSWMMLYR